MSNEEKLFELHRIQQLPRTSKRRYCLDILRELDNSATLAFYQNRADIKLVRIGERSLCISKKNGEKLCNEMSRLIGAQACQTFALRVTTVWRSREVRRRTGELRAQPLRHKTTGVRYHLCPNYVIDSKLVLEPQETLKLPTAHDEKLLEQAETLLDRVEKKTTCQPDGGMRVGTLIKQRTLEERAYEQYRLNSGQGKPDVIAEETAILVATRLSCEGHELPFLRPNEVLGKYHWIRERIQETLRKAHKATARQCL